MVLENGANPLPSLLSTPFRLDRHLVVPARNRIVRGQREVAVQPRVMDLLCLLAAEPGRTFARPELREAVWGGVVVGEAAIDRAVCCLRRVLMDDARRPRFVETVRKRGVRLRVPVVCAADVVPLTVAPATLHTMSFRFVQVRCRTGERTN
jgi:DNA-binding winged helix-turn-helix (wHTH) protein